MKSKLKYSDISVFKTVDEYYGFTKKYKVYGIVATKLKKQLDRLKI